MEGAQKEMPQYQCHKKVWALKIMGISQSENHALNGWDFKLVPEDDKFAPVIVTSEWLEKHAPKIGGYYVVYDDGYQSYSPAAAFEAGYTRI